MTRLLLLLALGLGAGTAGAEVLTQATGLLGTLTANATATANSVRADGAPVLMIYTDTTSVAGTNSGVVCQRAAEDGGTYTDITDSATAQTNVPTFAIKKPICVIFNPMGTYRVNNSTCNSTCSLVVRYVIGGRGR